MYGGGVYDDGLLDDGVYGGGVGYGLDDGILDGGLGYGGGYGDELGYGGRDYAYDDIGVGYGDSYLDRGVGIDRGLELGGGMGLGGLGGGMGYGGVEGGYYDGDKDDLYDSMSYVDREIPLVDAWGMDVSGWGDEQAGLADLVYYQQQLETNRELDESERMRRWEERLRWEELGEEERRMRYSTMDPYMLQTLGLSGGWWGQRFGGRNDLDLGYLRNVNLSRGLFSTPYRNVYNRFNKNLGARYSPYIPQSRLRGLGGVGRVGGLGGGLGYGRGSLGYGGGVGYRVGGGSLGHVGAGYGARRASFGSRPLASAGLSLRADELRTRLRLAETRASMTGLASEQRARALEDARRIRAEINQELRVAQDIDRSGRHEDALLNAREDVAQNAELARELREDREVARTGAAVAGVGGFGVGLGGRGFGLGGGRMGYNGYAGGRSRYGAY